MIDPLQEEILKGMPEGPFQVEQIEIEWIDLSGGIMHRPHADVPLPEIEGDLHIPIGSCLQEDRIDPILVDREY